MTDATPERIPLGRFISFAVFVVYWFYAYANLGHEIAYPPAPATTLSFAPA